MNYSLCRSMWWGRWRKLLPLATLNLQHATRNHQEATANLQDGMLNLQDSSADPLPLHSLLPVSIGVFLPRRGGLFASHTEKGQTEKGKKRGLAASKGHRKSTNCWRGVRWKGPASGFRHIWHARASWRQNALQCFNTWIQTSYLQPYRPVSTSWTLSRWWVFSAVLMYGFSEAQTVCTVYRIPVMWVCLFLYFYSDEGQIIDIRIDLWGKSFKVRTWSQMMRIGGIIQSRVAALYRSQGIRYDIKVDSSWLYHHLPIDDTENNTTGQIILPLTKRFKCKYNTVATLIQSKKKSQHFEKFTLSLSCWELDEEIETTLTFVR